MLLTMFKSKIHRATITGSELNYMGSITIDPALLKASGILPYEQVDVLNINNGARFTTYAIAGKTSDSGEITVNGAAVAPYRHIRDYRRKIRAHSAGTLRRRLHLDR